MWDHGAGPVYGFGIDNNNSNKTLSLQETVQAFNESSLIKDGKRFDLINYDACLMSSVEVVAALCGYADTFVCSTEDVPGGGQDYTVLMNTLNSDLSIGGFDLGKQIVDAYITQYGVGTDDDAMLSTLSVIDAENFKTRLLPLLNTLSEILLSEAKNKGDINGIYNFYDELYSEYAAYENGVDGSYDLFDLGNLVSALGCWQTEADNLSTDAIKNYQNSYTELAADIMTILADDDNSGDDVIYSGSTSDMKKIVTNHNLRVDDGTMTAYNDGIPYEELPTGLSIFYPSSDIVPAYDYQDVMTDLAQVLPEGDSRTFFESYTHAVTYYGLINSFGSVISESAVDENTAPDYETVKAKLQSDGLWEDYYETMLSSLVANGEFASLDEAEAFFADIVAQQSAEAVTKEKIEVSPIMNSSDEIVGYITETSQTSAHTLNEAGSYLRVISAPDDTGFKMYLSYLGYSYFQRQLYFPDGFVFNLYHENGVMQTDLFIEDESDSDELIKQRAYGANDVSFSIKRPSNTCLVLYDADENPHVADAVFLNKEHTEAAIPIVTFEKYYYVNNYYLYVKKTNNWQIEGLSTHLNSSDERDYIPMDSDIFAVDDNSWISFTTVSEMTDAVYGETNMIPISNFADFDKSVENWGITVSEKTVSSLGLTSSRYYYLKDVYGSEIDITELMKEADADAGIVDLIDIADAEITVTVDDGTTVVTVMLGDTVLVEDTDYTVTLGTDVLGKPQATVVGIGRYTGSKTCLYTDPSKEYPYTVLIDGTAAIDSYLGVDTEIVIPSHLDGYTVSAINIGALIGSNAFGYLDKSGGFVLVEGFTIIGKAGSAAQAYAEANGIPFREVTEVLLGDADGDGEVTVLDVTMMQRVLAKLSGAVIVEATADVDGNGEVNVVDATYIQRYTASMPVKYPINEYVVKG